MTYAIVVGYASIVQLKDINNMSWERLSVALSYGAITIWWESNQIMLEFHKIARSSLNISIVLSYWSLADCLRSGYFNLFAGIANSIFMILFVACKTRYIHNFFYIKIGTLFALTPNLAQHVFYFYCATLQKFWKSK